ncbi:hypothetical protein GCM10009555_098180 [Acrocarpospora macrocephala]|uniref:Uncharacterized protein n=1 Tax=Acrocarpospora macrocephala TaxID=150177 RepID=A0A5M3WZ46_9ACTN|nr:hypothetical protein Amac_061980 [Acrocarpospora macrocephala]
MPAVGVGLHMLVLRTRALHPDPNLVPALILLGASVVPTAFLTSTQARSGWWRVPSPILALAAFFGGVIGVARRGAAPAKAGHLVMAIAILQNHRVTQG